MNDGLKQRVVGAIVLLIMAVLFLPMIFDLNTSSDLDKTSKLPESPEIQKHEMQELQRPDAVPLPAQPDQVYQLEAPEDKPVATPGQGDSVLALDEQGLPVSWVLQLGSFKDKGHALSLESRLIEAGYKAFHREFSSEQLYRVYVGPYIDKSDLKSVQKSIMGKLKLESIIVEFKP